MPDATTAKRLPSWCGDMPRLSIRRLDGRRGMLNWDVGNKPTLDNIGLADVDLSSAEMIGHSGRDTVVMEKTDEGIAIYFADAIGGTSPYEMKIGFLRAK
jgi:hypothetical protein